MSARTPGPWSINSGHILLGADRHDVGIIWRGQFIGDKPRDDANAEFIVRAVNNHDELVAALERCVSILEQTGPSQRAICLESRAALAAAKETP